MHRYEVWIASKKKAWKPSSLARIQREGNSHPFSQSQDWYVYIWGGSNTAIQVSCHGWVHLQGYDTQPSFILPSPQHIAGRDAAQPEASLATTKQVTEAQQKHTTRFSLMLSDADKHIISSNIQGKVRDPRPFLIYTRPTLLTTMENRKKTPPTDEFHTDTQTLSRSSSR